MSQYNINESQNVIHTSQSILTLYSEETIFRQDCTLQSLTIKNNDTS